MFITYVEINPNFVGSVILSLISKEIWLKNRVTSQDL